MLVIVSVDWFGTQEAFEKYKKDWMKVCEETSGVKSTKLYTSHQARYHYAWFTKTESYGAVMEAFSKMPARDRNVMTHSVIEVFTEM